MPAKSTVHAVLDRYGLVARRGRARHRAQGTALSLGQAPNELWCADYKGEFLLGNRQYCYPLTVTDHARAVFLSEREQRAFVKACAKETDFQQLVRAGLYTGARYGELGRWASAISMLGGHPFH